MTSATRDALQRVGQILHEAGWDESPPTPPELTDETLRVVRRAYENLLREDHQTMLNHVLGKGQRVEDAGRALGVGPEESRRLLAEALTRLRDFVAATEI